jgi:hypothetical protein
MIILINRVDAGLAFSVVAESRCTDRILIALCRVLVVLNGVFI